jgi:hypothetical protein
MGFVQPSSVTAKQKARASASDALMHLGTGMKTPGAACKVAIANEQPDRPDL